MLARRKDIGYSVSCTTRPARSGEVDGRDYHFLTEEEFVRRADHGDFAESAQVHGRMYGTLRSEVQKVLDSGRHVLMDIDVQGAARFSSAFPSSVLIFLLPPSAAVMVQRLTARRSESQKNLGTRLRTARSELAAIGHYQYVIVNDNLDEAIARVSSVIDAESVKQNRVRELEKQVTALISQLEHEIAVTGGGE